MAEILSGGLTWGSIQQAIVTMDKEGHPLTCCNPVTGECLGGGGSGDFSTAKVTISHNMENTEVILVAPGIQQNNEIVSMNAISTTPRTLPVIVPSESSQALTKYRIFTKDISGNLVAIDSANFICEGNCDDMGIWGDCTILVSVQ